MHVCWKIWYFKFSSTFRYCLQFLPWMFVQTVRSKFHQNYSDSCFSQQRRRVMKRSSNKRKISNSKIFRKSISLRDWILKNFFIIKTKQNRNPHLGKDTGFLKITIGIFKRWHSEGQEQSHQLNKWQTWLWKRFDFCRNRTAKEMYRYKNIARNNQIFFQKANLILWQMNTCKRKFIIISGNKMLYDRNMNHKAEVNKH